MELNNIMNDDCFVEKPDVCNSTRRPESVPQGIRNGLATRDEFADVREPVAETEAAADVKAHDGQAADEKNTEHAVIE